MILKGRIVQIIRWEKRNSYFDLKSLDGAEYDVIVVGDESEISGTWLSNWINSWKRIPLTNENFSFPISLCVKKPNKYNVNDLITLDLNIVQKHSDNSVNQRHES